ncbi:MAG TPA: signal peptidase II [Polyangiaceae bacterium]|nr:signal peptidase II [Polyangiaceae bacterium]
MPAPSPSEGASAEPPSFVFFAVVAAVSLVADIATKVWAEITLLHRASHPIVLIEDHLNLTLAYNPGGAWGLAQNASEQLRKPFFVLVSMAAIWFIFSLYGRLAPGQQALKWGLPLVLGGALGNLADRLTRSQVIDFIDYRADWIRSMNTQIARIADGWSVTDHWPTFNVADIAICVGVGLMAVDMFTSRRGPVEALEPAPMTQKSIAPSAPRAEEDVRAGSASVERAVDPRNPLDAPHAGNTATPGGAAAGGGAGTSVGDVPER